MLNSKQSEIFHLKKVENKGKLFAKMIARKHTRNCLKCPFLALNLKNLVLTAKIFPVLTAKMGNNGMNFHQVYACWLNFQILPPTRKKSHFSLKISNVTI